MNARRLDRLLRVRTLQLGMVQAEESDAARRLADERALRDRVDQLMAGVAPSATPTDALSLTAAAHYRQRLQQTAEAAERRVAGAERQLDQARGMTMEARRDQGAMEKLLDRAGKEAAALERRALESLPHSPKAKRHDPC